MFVHISLPGFHALVHQVERRALRQRPVAVATDLSERAPILACSTEAYAAGVERSQRIDAARRRCPELVVLKADVEGARRLQAEVAAAALAFTPLVASAPGRWVVDLRGSESFWCTRLRPGQLISDRCQQAELIAQGIRERIGDDVGLVPFIGVANQPLTALLAARLARTGPLPHAGMVVISPEHEKQVIDPLPVHWLPLSPPLRDQLFIRHHFTIGAFRALGAEGLRSLGGQLGSALHAQLAGSEHLLPAALDAEPHCSAESMAGPGAAGPETMHALISGLAQQVGDALRRAWVAATRISLTVRWRTGCTRHSTLAAGYHVRDDRDLIQLAEQLLVRADDEAGQSCTWLRLTASGLCTAEDPQGLFRAESARRETAAPKVVRVADQAKSGPSMEFNER